MINRLTLIVTAEKWGSAVPLSGARDLGPHLTQCRLGRGLPP